MKIQNSNIFISYAINYYEFLVNNYYNFLNFSHVKCNAKSMEIDTINKELLKLFFQLLLIKIME